MFIPKKEVFLFFGILILFFLVRMPGLDNLYHQDEYKWPIIVNPALTEPGGIPHPPVGEFIYRQAGFIVGYDNFRLVPLFFGFLNLLLIFYLVKNIFDTRIALWSAGLFTISFYSVLASLMIDTDGAIMPFFFLISLISYFKLKNRNFQFRIFDFQNSKWLGLMIFGMIGGFFVKASFVIVIAAVAIDFAFEKGIFSDRKTIFKYLFYAFGGIVILFFLLLLAKILFPFFNLEASIKYWEHFFKLGDRGWLQTGIQFTKAVMYISPLLVMPLFWVNKEIFKKTRVFFIFIGLGLLFYLIIFDFSTGALDRYFQFLIIPLCIISGTILSRLEIVDFKFQKIMIPVLFSVVIFGIQFLDHFVPPLYPKTEWLNRIVSLEWNFLFPFTGGSGPTGFYISFMFIALIWLVSLIFIRKKMLLVILILGLLYNFIFIEEYLFGKINGNPYVLFQDAKEYIEKNNLIKKVVVYNDIGGYEIQKIGKYERRMYASPQFEQTYRDFFKNFNGNVLYINIPRIGDNNFYSDYIAKCDRVYNDTDKYISASIYDCNKLK